MELRKYFLCKLEAVSFRSFAQKVHLFKAEQWAVNNRCQRWLMWKYISILHLKFTINYITMGAFTIYYSVGYGGPTGNSGTLQYWLSVLYDLYPPKKGKNPVAAVVCCKWGKFSWVCQDETSHDIFWRNTDSFFALFGCNHCFAKPEGESLIMFSFLNDTILIILAR